MNFQPSTKPRYKKPESVKELERLANRQAQEKYSFINPRYLAPRLYRDDTANRLTVCIVKYISLCGGFASRLNNQGTYNLKLRKYIPSTSKKGLPDIIATYKGLSLHIEVKTGRDKQSDFQKKIESEVIQAGGIYFLATNFTLFKNWFDNL
jgi:hypothetical protein